MFEPSFNFLRLPDEYSDKENSFFKILPVGYDATTSYLPGTRKGPYAIIEASINLEWYDIELDLEPYLSGIHTLNPVAVHAGSANEMMDRIYKAASMYTEEERFLLGIGGEHSVSLGFIKAHKDVYGDDFTVIHFDAHADVRESYEDCEYSHASVIKNVYNSGIRNIVQIGIRSMDIDEKHFLENSEIVTVYASEIYENLEKSINKILSSVKHKKVYITFDVDAFDTSLIWDTGTPEPGGLLWYDVLKILKKIFEKHEVIGADVVELIGNSPANSSIIGKLIYKIMGYKVWQKNFK